ncbi:MBL fold metallo-hydrolase [Candidatus Woesearchaeota archaeon]|nr:MBL fold metallo-hydrolase [Candidatus Woesearchaeota archaeon]
MIETKGYRILIDPSYLNFSEYFLKSDWVNVDVLLVTHKHKSHCHDEAVQVILDRDQAQFFSSKEVAKSYPSFEPNIVEVGDKINLEVLKIEVVKAVHGFLPTSKDDKVHEGFGFIIDDGETRLYHTGDTICFDNNYKADVVLAPVSGRGLVMGPYEAALFAKACGAKLLIPCHMDNPKYPVSHEVVKKNIEEHKVEFKILKVEESIEV